MDFENYANSTSLGIRRLRSVRSEPACSGSLRRWKRWCRPEQYMGMVWCSRLLETTAHWTVAARARRCRHRLSPCIRSCDYLRRTKQRHASERYMGTDPIRLVSSVAALTPERDKS